MGVADRKAFGQSSARLVGLKNESFPAGFHGPAVKLDLGRPAANEQEPDIVPVGEQGGCGQQGLDFVRPAKIAGIFKDERVRRQAPILAQREAVGGRGYDRLVFCIRQQR